MNKLNTINQATINNIVDKVQVAVLERSTNNYFVAAVAATIVDCHVVWDKPYNSDTNKYKDELPYRLLSKDSDEEYFHVRSRDTCYPKDSKVCSLVKEYANYIINECHELVDIL